MILKTYLFASTFDKLISGLDSSKTNWQPIPSVKVISVGTEVTIVLFVDQPREVIFPL